MTEKAEAKVEALPDLDDLLQCPVCYEIPAGQIFQCNEGHHVCGRCKMRLDVCPVCRAFFFGTRNYAMEELIANVRKLQAFKLGGKITTTGTPPAEANTENKESSSEENESVHENEEDEDVDGLTSARRAPPACKGLFRCLCCKNNPERLPSARLLNHLRYYHSNDLIEGRSENGGYLQAWQFPTIPGRIVTAVRVADMGIFYLIIEITDESVQAWMQMAASPWVAHEHYYTFTLSGNDREAIFSDCTWSVRSCEGSLKKRGRCLSVSGTDARALLQPAAMCGRLALRRTPRELLPQHSQPRAVLRVASRSRAPHALEPFLQDLENDVARLTRAFATLGNEANALRSAAERRARLESAPRAVTSPAPATAPRAAGERSSAATAPRSAAIPASRSPAVPAPRSPVVSAPRSPVVPAPRSPAVPVPRSSAVTEHRASAATGPRASTAPAPRAAVAPREPEQEGLDLMTRTGARRMRHRIRVALAANDVPRSGRTGDSWGSDNDGAARVLNNGPSSGDATGTNRNQNSGAPERAPTAQRTNRSNIPRASNNQTARLQNQTINSVVRPNAGVVLSAAATPSARSGLLVAAASAPQAAARPASPPRAPPATAGRTGPPAPPPSFGGPAPQAVTNGNNGRNKRRRRNRR